MGVVFFVKVSFIFIFPEVVGRWVSAISQKLY